MARTIVTGEGGFAFNETDVAGRIVQGEGEVLDSIARTDLDGDGQLRRAGATRRVAARGRGWIAAARAADTC